MSIAISSKFLESFHKFTGEIPPLWNPTCQLTLLTLTNKLMFSRTRQCANISVFITDVLLWNSTNCVIEKKVTLVWIATGIFCSDSTKMELIFFIITNCAKLSNCVGQPNTNKIQMYSTLYWFTGLYNSSKKIKNKKYIYYFIYFF